jgi:hypothetical protein
MVEVSFFIFFSAISLTVMFTGVWFSLTIGTRPNGWSDTVAVTCLVGMSVLTLAALYQLEKVYYGSSFGTVYGWLIIWYFILFFFGQRLLVRHFRKRASDN